ncbi:hypothetical protein AMATHDRAFT_7996 [Amanita thiersii Skay4041]|uniref:Uncharacterized protein n=1 Tax=Amanita thiersii Skay4041 TaxID=703135 RepID=A0A2A9N7D5_9AGAR|nr:hypothetical protein AMATHDRAFT_7996 [Amanita thiersii Skay4041]
MITPTEASIVALFVQALLYGLYIATFLHCLRWLIFKDEGWDLRKEVNWPKLFVTLIIFGLSTSQLALALRIMLITLMNDGTSIKNISTAKYSLETITAVIVNGLLVRPNLPSPEQRNEYSPSTITDPSLSSSIVCLILSICSVSGLKGLGALTPSTSQEAFYATILAMNAYAACAIMFTIWNSTKETNDRQDPFRFGLRLVSESGVLSALTTIMLLSTTVLTSNRGMIAQMFTNSINFSMVGIVFNLVLIREARRRATKEVVKPKPALSTIRFNNVAANTISVFSTRHEGSMAFTRPDQSTTDADMEQGSTDNKEKDQTFTAI